MADVPAVISHVITVHAGLPGARLSKPGHWGNIAFPSPDAAQAAAIADGAIPGMIGRETYKKPTGENPNA